MTFTQLEIFALVAELGNFTAAGAKLGISQSAVSHAIKQLETEWGIALLSRGASGVEVTTAAQALLIRVRELLGVSEALRQEVLATKGLQQGALRIGSFGTTSSLQLLPKILAEFSKRCPHVEVYVDEGEDDEVAQWIAERRVDVGFVVLPEERFETVPLIEDQFIALLPATHELADAKSVSLQALSEMPFIMTSAGNLAPIERLLASAGVRPHIKHRYAQIITIVRMVESGAGVSIVADLSVPDEILALCPNVVKVPLAPVAKRSVGLAFPSKRQLSPAADRFIKVSREVMVGAAGVPVHLAPTARD